MDNIRIQEIKSAVERCRMAIELSDWNLDMSEYFILNSLKARCKPASMLIARYLLENLGCKPIEFVSAYGWKNSEPLSRPHFWLEHHNLIVDITADQFPEIDEPVTVTMNRAWYDQFHHQSRYPYSDVVNSDTVQKYYATYAHVLNTLHEMNEPGFNG